jgi:hypothetical protein
VTPYVAALTRLVEANSSRDPEANAFTFEESMRFLRIKKMGDNPSKTMHGYGFYYETWELVNGEWKLARLELRRNIVFRA